MTDNDLYLIKDKDRFIAISITWIDEDWNTLQIKVRGLDGSEKTFERKFIESGEEHYEFCRNSESLTDKDIINFVNKYLP